MNGVTREPNNDPRYEFAAATAVAEGLETELNEHGVWRSIHHCATCGKRFTVCPPSATYGPDCTMERLPQLRPGTRRLDLLPARRPDADRDRLMIAVSSALHGPPLTAAIVASAYMLWWLVRYSRGGVMSGDAVAMERLFPVHQEQLTSDDYYTPAWIFERMGIGFDLDVCSPPGGVAWVPATKYYTVTDDGLTAPWEGRVWMNPPYSHTSAWSRRFIQHRNGVCLVPHAKSAWHIELFNAADGICAPSDGYFDFVGNIAGKSSIFMPVMFAAFGSECVEAIGRLGVVRTVPA